MAILQNKYFQLAFIVGIAVFFRIYKLDSYTVWEDEKSSIGVGLGIPYESIILSDTAHVTIFSFASGDKDAIFNINTQNWIQEFKGKNGEIFTGKHFEKFNTLPYVFKAVIQDNGSMFYFIVLHYWIKLFGAADFSVRFLSLVFSVLSVVLIYFVAQLIFDSPQVALLSALLFMLHPLFIGSAQFARSHSMAVFFSLLSSYFFFKINNSKQNNWLFVGYVLSVIASLFSHLTTLYIFLAHGIILLLSLRDKKLWLKYLASGFILIVIYTTWLLNGGMESFKILSAVNKVWAQVATEWKPGNFLEVNLSNIIIGWIKIASFLFGNYCFVLGFKIKMLLILLIIPFVFLFQFYKYSSAEYRKKAMLISIFILVYLLFATAMVFRAKHTLIFNPAYGLYAIPYAILLLSGWIKHWQILPKRWLLLSLFLVQIILICLPYYKIAGRGYSMDENLSQRPSNPYIELSKKIENIYQQGDTIIYPTWEDAIVTNYYLSRNKNLWASLKTTLLSLSLRGRGEEKHPFLEMPILQKVEEGANKNKLIIKGTNAETKQIFDFEHARY